jgi:hypothetical protein
MASREQYRQQFNSNHPEAGELTPGSHITPEQATALGNIFQGKVLELSRKWGDLTLEEANFVDNIVDLGTRNVIALSDKGTLPTESPHLHELVKAASHLYRESGQNWPVDEVTTSNDVLKIMNGVTGAVVGVRKYPHLRTPVEDYAMHIMPYFAETVAQNGGAELDSYMTGNLQSLLAHYQIVEQQPIKA